MARIIKRIEDKAIKRYGFEAPQTIIIFKLTEIARKIMHIEMDF